MKRLVLLFVFILVGNLAFGQYQGQFRLQYGNDIGLSTGLFGMNIGGEFFPYDNISFAPNLSVLLPETGKASNLHLDARYYFSEDKLEFYGLVGYANYRRRFEFNPEITYQNTGTVNIGAGVLFKFLEELGLNAEIKLQPQNKNEFIIKLGISYFIN